MALTTNTPRDQPGTFRERTADELAALDAGFKARKKQERERFQRATDSEYWVAVCFTSRQQKETFLTLAGLSDVGDKYLDGRAFAAILGIPLAE